MTQEQETVLVQAFRRFGNHLENFEVAAFKATWQEIEALGGEPIPGTEQRVLPTELDDEGHFRRIATGWGGL